MKLYLKTAVHPFTIAGMLLMMIGMSLAFFIRPDHVGSEGYVSMISTIQTGKIGVFFIIMMGNLKLHQHKFYASSSCAKTLFTVAPMVTGLCVLLIYDTLLVVIAAVSLGSTGVADVIATGSVSNACMIIISAVYGKKRLNAWFVLAYTVFIFGPMFGKSNYMKGLMDLSVGTAAAAALGICAASVALSLFIVNTWWKKGDRAYIQNNIVLRSAG